MRYFPLVALVALAILSICVGPAAAQTTNESTPAATSTERIDSNTVIVDSRYLSNKSVARITLRSERPQSITLTDAGRFVTGGKVPTTTIVADEGTTTVEIPVTKVDGRVGVGISTRETRLYSEIIEAPSGPSPWEQTGSTTGWLGGASVVMTMTGLAALRVKRNNPTSPEMME